MNTGEPHVCQLPPLAAVGAEWRCPSCSAEWRSTNVGPAQGMWNRTFAEQLAQQRIAL